VSDVVAWAGIGILKKAQWDSANGYTVQFALEEPDGDDKSNPFKRFTKMRKNRVGTRFAAVIVVSEYKQLEAYNDEVMLKGWTDSNTGQTVSFWLANVGGNGHPFAAFKDGAQFAIALVELSDDNEAVDQKKRKRAEVAQEKPEPPAKKERHHQSKAEACAIICNNPLFWEFISSRNWAGLPEMSIVDAAGAARVVRWWLNISSRRELDTNPDVAIVYENEIRAPFVEWQRANGHL